MHSFLRQEERNPEKVFLSSFPRSLFSQIKIRYRYYFCIFPFALMLWHDHHFNDNDDTDADADADSDIRGEKQASCDFFPVSMTR